MAWPFDNQEDTQSVLPIDYGVQQLAKYANQNLGNNQNNSGIPWWMNADRSRYPSPMMPGMLDQTGQMGAGTNTPQASQLNTLDPMWQHQLRMQEIDRGNIDNRGINFPSIFGLVKGGLEGIKNQFKYRPAAETAWDPNTGQFVSAEEQDKMNALGGYYSDAARNQRRQRARVINMIKRREAGQEYGEDNLRRLQELGYGPKETITTTTVGDNINQGGGGYDRGYTQSQRAGVEAYHGRGGGKEMMSQGGRIGYALGTPDPDEPTEDIFEFIKDQNIPIGEQVEGEGDILGQLVAKYIEAGFPPDQAEEMAMQEFQQMAMGAEQDQGLASLV